MTRRDRIVCAGLCTVSLAIGLLGGVHLQPPSEPTAVDPPGRLPAANLREVYESLLRAMGDPALSDLDHQRAWHFLRRAQDAQAVDVVARGLGDTRRFGPTPIMGSQLGEFPDRSVTVGVMCRWTMHDYFPYGCKRHPAVVDWEPWWIEHQSKSWVELQGVMLEWEREFHGSCEQRRR